VTGVGDDAGRLVRFESDGPVARVTLDSPKNRNALSARLLAELHSALSAAASDDAIRAIVLTGSGKVFCSGADLKERLADQDDAGAEGSVGAQPQGGDVGAAASVPDVLSILAAAPKPVIGRINGAARAGGIGLVAACDLAAASESATFALSEVRVGVAPAMIAVALLRMMNPRRLRALTLTGEVFGANEAVAAGLLTAAVPDDELDEWVDARVDSVLRASPAAVRATKRMLDDLRLEPWSRAMAMAEALSKELFASPDAAEGMAAFLEKRPPLWAPEA
jgi:methylglutaconyl-CoA hydratase